MENNTRGIVIITLLSILIFQNCKTVKPLQHNNPAINNSILDSLNQAIKNDIAKIDTTNCNKPNLNYNSIGKTVCQNGRFFRCIIESGRAKEKHKLFELMNHLVDGRAKTYFVCLIQIIRDYNDETTFTTAIELLKYDWKPEGDTDPAYAPVYQYINDQLILPNIKSIDNKPWFQYFKEDPMRLLMNQKYIDHMSYYHQMKDLWESGRITLMSQE